MGRIDRVAIDDKYTIAISEAGEVWVERYGVPIPKFSPKSKAWIAAARVIEELRRI